MTESEHGPLSPEDVRGGAFAWDGDDDLLRRIIATADALAALERDLTEAREQLAQVSEVIAAWRSYPVVDAAQIVAAIQALVDSSVAAPTAQSAPANSEGARFECEDCAVGRDCPEHDAAPSADVQAGEPSDPSVQRRAVVALLYADDAPAAQPRAEERAHEPLGNNDPRIDLWDAINDYATACGGDPGARIYGNTRRQRAAVAVERALAELLTGGKP